MNWIHDIETRLAALEAATSIKDVPEPELSTKEQLLISSVYCANADETQTALQVFLNNGIDFRNNKPLEYWGREYPEATWYVTEEGYMNGFMQYNSLKNTHVSHIADHYTFPDFMAKFVPKQPETVTINVEGKDYVCRPMVLGEILQSTDIYHNEEETHFTDFPDEKIGFRREKNYYRPLPLPEPKAEVFTADLPTEVDTKDKLIEDVIKDLEQSGSCLLWRYRPRYQALTKK